MEYIEFTGHVLNQMNQAYNETPIILWPFTAIIHMGLLMIVCTPIMIVCGCIMERSK